MGSCVSNCSRQDVVHQQTGRVITDVQKSIEVTAGSALLQKSLVGIGTEAKLTEPREVRDQINAEIRALREQLVRSQVLFTYLLKNSSSENTKSPDGKKELCTLLEGGALGDAMFQCKSFDGQVLARLYNRSNRSSSSYTSHRSTPMHCGYTSLSCPTLPIDYPVVTKSTQTEPLSSASFYTNHPNNNGNILKSESTHSLNKGTSIFFSPPSTPCGTIPETFVLTDICEIHREPEDHTYPRHRTNSFLSAVKDGNPKLVDADFESKAEMKQVLCDEHETSHCSDEVLQCHQTLNGSNFTTHSNVFKPCEVDGKGVPDEKECVYPRKLSILLEEDYEDTSGNFSVSNFHQFLNRKRKMSQSCNANTQTDLPLSGVPSLTYNQKTFLPTKKTELPVTDKCFLKCGFTVVSQGVQKRTIHSVELPRKLVLRYPPPYTTKKYNIKRMYTSSENCFQENYSKHKSHIYNWTTAGESLPSKSESSHNLTPSSQNFRLQTRHLSLEKQESFSSCDHSLYPDSRMSSVTDCSGWINKSEVELNLRPDPPSYQESMLASQRNQLTRNSKLETGSKDCKSGTEKNTSVTQPSILERTKSDGDAKLIDDRNCNNKDKNVKYSQRSMRRGSGAGSPNSQLCIPRYPAFDFSEQEDVHSIFPSPSVNLFENCNTLCI